MLWLAETKKYRTDLDRESYRSSSLKFHILLVLARSSSNLNLNKAVLVLVRPDDGFGRGPSLGPLDRTNKSRSS